MVAHRYDREAAECIAGSPLADVHDVSFCAKDDRSVRDMRRVLLPLLATRLPVELVFGCVVRYMAGAITLTFAAHAACRALSVTRGVYRIGGGLHAQRRARALRRVASRCVRVGGALR